ncbi:MAG: hypothetical protein M3328_11685 [Chloroflexota bacterium]|nr:hypothetical protein [Chloroflexota bacterium]
MSALRNGRVREALRQALDRVYDPTTRTPVPWLLSGEAAMALQGVNIEPTGVEFRAMSQYATGYFAQLMKPFEAGPNTATLVYRMGGNTAPSDIWRSNVHQRIVAWSVGGRATWLGRWLVDGVTVQISYVRSIKADPTARAVRSHIARAPFEGMSVPVVPLEFLLAQADLKNNTHLTHRVLHALRARGYSPNTLQSALECISRERASRLSRLLEINLVAG